MGSISVDPAIHLVLAASGIYGHLRPLRSLSRQLVERGYSVTFVSSSAYRKSFETIKGVGYVSWMGEADLAVEEQHEWLQQRIKLQGSERFAFDLEQIFVRFLADQCKTLQSVFTRPELQHKKIVLVHESLVVGQFPMLLDAASLRRVPAIAVATYPVSVASKDVPPLFHGYQPENETKHRQLYQEESELLAQVHQVTKDQVQLFNCEKELPSKYFFDNSTLLPDLYLQSGIAEMEFPRSDLPANVRYIGVINGANDRKEMPEWFQSFVIDNPVQHPIILVTSGTIPTMTSDSLVIPTLEACADLPVRVIVCSVFADLPANYVVPANARCASWIPFEDIFPHTSIAVTNGGFGGICQAFSAGIPMVLAGEGEDKADTISRAAYTGAAINLETSTPSIEQLRAAIQRILEESQFKKKALELQEGLRKASPVDSVVAAIDEMVEKFY